MRALALLAVAVLASACDPRAANRSSDAAPAVSARAARGADPGGFLPTVCLGQEKLRFWRRFNPLTVTDEALERTRGTHCEWSVVVEGGEPIVTAAKHPRPATLRGFEGASAVEKGAPGYLVGFDWGEFGGSLSWFSLHGESKQTLLDESVLAILRTPEHFVVLTTEGHGDDGWAYEVMAYFDRFEVRRRVELPGAPTASAPEPGGGILLATREGLLRLSPVFELVPLLEARWSPLSLTLDANVAYVGMRGEVAAVQLSQKRATVTWFLPP